MTTAATGRRLHMGKNRYRVIHRDAIIGQFPNSKLAGETAHVGSGAIVVDMSMKPPKVICEDGKWIGI